MHTPVALIIFNRPEKTERVLAEIAKAKPRKLFVIADGPRPNCPNDIAQCSAVRKIIERVDWGCEVLKNYSEVNLGCGRRPATGTSWVFEYVEEAIILEDDIVPHPTFFRFCEELLEKYRNDWRVMMIGGFTMHPHCSPYSYRFSRIFGCVGGWATWRRAWQYWDGQMTLWPTLRDDTSWMLDIMGESRVVEHWRKILERAYTESSHADYWDYQWMFACWAQSGLAIVPTVNLISNIGFGADATHTKSVSDGRANLPTAAMRFPLQHPPYMIRNRDVDYICFQGEIPAYQRQQSLYWQLRRRVAAAIPRVLRQRISSLLTVARRRSSP